MQPDTAAAWKNYRAQMLSYLRLLPLGVVIAAVPLLYNLGEWQREGAVGVGLALSVIYGLVVPLAIWFSYGAFYGARIWLGARAGAQLRYPWITYVLINVVGLWLGLWLSFALIHLLLGMPASGGEVWFSLLFGLLAMVFFAMYFAYRRAREESLALRAAVAEARYHTLENQMRPHFLFNALNSLAELIEAEHGAAAETTYKLAELYRRILANSTTKTAALASELEIVRAYLEIEQLRFGARLRYEIEVAPELGEIFLPSLVLQTLVENAVKHGLTPSLTGGEIRVAITRAAAGLYLARVSNTGQPLKSAPEHGGAGLANTQARLTLLYGARHQFALAADEAGRTTASFLFTGERFD
jgi:sensor histidine kinase YesM